MRDERACHHETLATNGNDCATWRCGHRRTPDNTLGHGTAQYCATCAEKRRDLLALPKHERYAVVAGLRKSGMSIAALAERFGYSQKTIRDFISAADPQPRTVVAPDFCDRVIATAAELAGARVHQLLSDWRAPKQLVHGRWAAMMTLHDAGLSTTAIGRRMNRDHTTIIYGLRRGAYWRDRSPEFRDMLEKVRAA